MVVLNRPKEQLAKQISWKVLAKHQDNLFQLEAILFGCAGFLDSQKDEYSQQLKKEFDFLRHKYSLNVLGKKLWKFLRLRPANFPTVRIAQLAALFQNTGAFYRWFSNQADEILLKSLRISPSEYWRMHYSIGTEIDKLVSRLVAQSFTSSQIEVPIDLRDDRIMA